MNTCNLIKYVDWNNPPIIPLDIIYKRYQGVEVTSNYNPDLYFSTSLIGKGYQGNVYKVIDTETNMVVALKFSRMNERLYSIAEITNSCVFASTKAFTSSLSLPLNWSIIAEPKYNIMVISMPYIDGPVFSGKLEEETFMSGLFEIIIAMKAIHDIGYTHNDLHPDNILTLTTDEIRVYNINNIQYIINNPLKPVIIDFGLSVKTTDIESFSHDYQLLGYALINGVSGVGREMVENLSKLGQNMLLHENFYKYRSATVPAGSPIRIFENIYF